VSADTPISLFGLYRVRNTAPGFAICLFCSPEGTVCAQRVGDDGCITGFASVNVEGSIVFDAPLRPDGEEWSARVGQRVLYAFHRPDGRFAIGTREDVEAAVREELPNLRGTPFQWEEAASFVGDQEQLKLANAVTAELLRRPTPPP
jgi:hypothetical protein